MAKQRSETLRRKEKVRAAVDLRGVPEGTDGRVVMVNGVTWTRYWVAFDNGVEMGSIDRAKLVRADEWDQYLTDREAAARRAEEAAAEVDGTDDGDAPEAAAAGGGGATVNGVAVPPHLLERTKSALGRLGVSR